jgi:YegS/Rv2252/BmrU family lipid kinase
MKKLLFVYNPHSGKGQIASYLSDIIDVFVKNEYEVTVYPTQSRGYAKKLVSDVGSNYDMIVCSGGDSTLNETISGMMTLSEKPTLGYIPAGSTNDFAQSIKLSKDMVESANMAMEGMPIAVDIGSFNKKNFVYVAAFGTFTNVSYATPQDMKNVLGHSAYVVEAVKELASIQSYHLRVKHNNGIEEGEYIYGMISNSISVGGLKGITGKNIVLDDGLFEMTLVKKPKNPLDLNLIIGNLLGIDVKSDCVTTVKASKIRIESTEKIPWVLDGEFGGDLKKVNIDNNKRAIKIMSGITKTKTN